MQNPTPASPTGEELKPSTNEQVTKPIAQQAPFPFGKGGEMGPMTLRTRQDQLGFVQSPQLMRQAKSTKQNSEFSSEFTSCQAFSAEQE